MVMMMILDRGDEVSMDARGGAQGVAASAITAFLTSGGEFSDTDSHR